MYKHINLIIMKILISALLLFSLTAIGQEQIIHYSLNSAKTKELEGKIIKTDELIFPNSLLIIDSLMIIRNNDTNNDFFNLINLKSGKIISSFCKKGRGPGEVIYPMSFQIIPETAEFLVYDVNMKKVSYYDWNKILENNPDNYLRSFRVDSAYAKYVYQINNGKYFCPLVGDNIGYKYFTMTRSGQFEKMGSLLPDIGKEYPKIISSSIFKYMVGINNEKNKVVMAYYNWDRIEIMDISSGSEITIDGPKAKIPDFISSEHNITLDGKTALYTYYSPVAGEEGFFVLFSGDYINDPKSKKPKRRKYTQALHFDYGGKLLAVYNLTPGADYITVDWERKIIYGVNNEMEPVLLEYRF